MSSRYANNGNNYRVGNNAYNNAPQPQRVEMTMSNSGAFGMGFFGGLGSGLATMVFTFAGLLLFVPGLVIVMRQTKKPKDQRSRGWLVFGFVLMALGMVVGMGMGLLLFGGLLMENV